MPIRVHHNHTQPRERRGDTLPPKFWRPGTALREAAVNIPKVPTYPIYCNCAVTTMPSSHPSSLIVLSRHSPSSLSALPRWQLPEYGTNHAKMIILKFPTGIRVVVLTANFIVVDVTDKSQGVWYQDFPKRTSGSCAFQVCSDRPPANATGRIWRRHCAPLPCRNSPLFCFCSA